MPEPNINKTKGLPAGDTEPTETQAQAPQETKRTQPEMTAEERARKFQLIKDDIFSRRAKLMKRLAE